MVAKGPDFEIEPIPQGLVIDAGRSAASLLPSEVVGCGLPGVEYEVARDQTFFSTI